MSDLHRKVVNALAIPPYAYGDNEAACIFYNVLVEVEAALRESGVPSENAVMECPECNIRFDPQWKEKGAAYRASLKIVAPQAEPSKEDGSAVAGQAPAVAAPSSESAVTYHRWPDLDKRFQYGDDFAGDAWVRWVAVGHDPNVAPREITAEASSPVQGEGEKVQQSAGTHTHPVPTREAEAARGAAPLLRSAEAGKPDRMALQTLIWRTGELIALLEGRYTTPTSERVIQETREAIEAVKPMLDIWSAPSSAAGMPYPERPTEAMVRAGNAVNMTATGALTYVAEVYQAMRAAAPSARSANATIPEALVKAYREALEIIAEPGVREYTENTPEDLRIILTVVDVLDDESASQIERWEIDRASSPDRSTNDGR